MLRNSLLFSALSKSPPLILYMGQLSNSMIFNRFHITQISRTNERDHRDSECLVSISRVHKAQCRYIFGFLTIRIINEMI